MNSIGKPRTPALVKVVFYLGENEWHGYKTETVWAEKISEGRCRLRNVPFFAKGVGCDDVVFVSNNDGSLSFDSVSMSAGHSTYRVIVDSDVSAEIFEEYWKSLESLGCSYESAEGKKKLIAVDVPPKADIYKVYSVLEKGESENVWSFEEGHCGHPLK
jgi:hypothetical protein